MLLIAFTVLCIIIRSETLTTGCRRKDAEVLILGAGMAGISTAKTLSEKTITHFILLEADDDIGGRVKSIVLKSGVRLELSAKLDSRDRPRRTREASSMEDSRKLWWP